MMKSSCNRLLQCLGSHAQVDVEIFNVQLAGYQFGEQEVAGCAEVFIA